MGIFRLLTILLIAWLAYALYKRYLKNKSSKRPDKHPSKKINEPEKVVKCEYCATHVPMHEAIMDKGRYYCSEEHKRISNN